MTTFHGANGLAGTGIKIGGGPSLRTALGGFDLGLGDHDPVGIGRTGDLAFELRIGSVQHDRSIRGVDDGIALPLVERHLPAALPKLSLRLGEGHLACRNLVLQRLGESDNHVSRCVQLRDPVLQHASLAQRSRERDDGADRQRRQRNHARQFRTNFQTAKQTHFDPPANSLKKGISIFLPIMNVSGIAAGRPIFAK
jgi:hypothetical protein